MQLVKHIMRVQFRGPYEEFNSYERTVNCADIELSRNLGREIAVWMAKGVGYSVESTTLEIERK